MPDASTPPDPPINVKDIDNAPDNVQSKIGPVDYKTEYEKYHSKFTELSEENFRLKEEISDLRDAVHTSQTLDSLIHPYASKSFWFMVSYASFVGLMILLDAVHVGLFHVETGVIKILIGSTAANVIGLVGMVLTGVFVGARKRR